MSDDQQGSVKEPVLLAGRYQVEEELGRGGMAKVFRGTDTVLGRPVAIKVLAPHFAEDLNFVARFRREAQAAARLNHPNLVGVYDTGSDDGVHYIVMEYVDAKTLADYLAGGGRIMPDRAIELAEAVCRALSVAHAHGVIHRDIKPANIMVTARGEVKVTDFGIARMTEGADTIAQTAAVLGTASYLSPEQARGEPVDQRTDIYSLGVVLYEMVTGRPPFSGDTPVAVASKHVLEQPKPPSKLNPDVPAALDAVIMKALAKNPANRYQTAEELTQDLERVRVGQPVGATPLLAEEVQTQVIAGTTPAPAAGGTAVLPPQPGLPEEPRRRWWVGVIVALLILAALGAGAYILATGLLGGNDQPATPTVKVPNVVGLKLKDAIAKIEDAGLTVADPVQRETDPNADPGTVIRQDPQADAQVDKDSAVTLTVAKAPTFTIPTGLVGQPADQVQATLEGLGLTVNPTTDTSPTVPEGNVISLDPPEGSTVREGDTVTMVVSSGAGQVTVADLVCEPLGKAQSDLQKAGLGSVIAQGTQYNAECPQPGKVAAMDPGPGTSVDAGTVITLIESTNESPPPTESPSPTESPTP
jgi:serine/threonine-protein kinase